MAVGREQKKCTRCRQSLPLTAFHADKTKSDGYYTVCKDCRAGRTGGVAVPHGYRQCKHCDRLLPDSQFYDADKQVRRRSCIDCCEQRWQKSYRPKTHRVGNGPLTLFGLLPNAERVRLHRNKPSVRAKVRATDARYRQSPKGKTARATWVEKNLARLAGYAHARRARAQGVAADFSPDDWQATRNAFGNACVYCGAADCALAQEHWVPLVRGGGYTLGNIVPACKSCNSRKGTQMPQIYCSTEQYTRIQRVLTQIARRHDHNA